MKKTSLIAKAKRLGRAVNARAKTQRVAALKSSINKDGRSPPTMKCDMQLLRIKLIT